LFLVPLSRTLVLGLGSCSEERDEACEDDRSARPIQPFLLTNILVKLQRWTRMG
jgi:hypothetical protein